MNLTVILCTHNPRLDYLRRTITSLQQQTLGIDQWELIVVDNASSRPVADDLELGWHPQAQVVVEPVPGLTRARIKGIHEATSPLILFIDDDNELHNNFLENTLKLAVQHPEIGCFGGILNGEFEAPVPEWFKPHLEMLAVRPLERDVWSNLYTWESTPSGAGMVIRTHIARQWAALTINNIQALNLGRKGNNTFSGEDVDLAYTAIDMGFGCARFTALELTHLIPAGRLEEAYLKRLYAGVLASSLIINKLRKGKPIPQIHPVVYRLKMLYFRIFKTQEEVLEYRAIFAACALAAESIKKN